jgi:hypothetical protein
VTPTVRIEQALYTLLSEDAALLAALENLGATPNADALYWRGMPALDTPVPFVVFEMLAGTDDTTRCGPPASSKLVYQIKVIAAGNDMVALEPVADRLDTLIAGHVETLDGFRLHFQRASSLAYTEGTPPGEFSHLGFTYNVRAGET